MAKFRQKPIVVEAIWWNPRAGARRFQTPPIPSHLLRWSFWRNCWRVKTVDGQTNIRLGDWIVRGPTGEYHPCKPDIFEQTYEPANEETNNE